MARRLPLRRGLARVLRLPPERAQHRASGCVMAVDAVRFRGKGIAVGVGGDRLAQLAFGAVAVHVVDDNFLQPNSGVSPVRNLAGGTALLAVVVAAALLQACGRPGLRAASALVGGWLGVLVG